MRYVIGDLHLGHDSIIDYCSRPFANVSQMNNELVEQWNTTVDPDDTVLLLGDVSLDKARPTSEWVKRLNGHILLVRGNHDSDVAQNATVNVVEQCTVQHGRYEFYCEHEPTGFSGWSLHGHVHNSDLVTYPFIHQGAQRVNVSADVIGFTPLRMDRLVKLLDKRETFATISDAEAGEVVRG